MALSYSIVVNDQGSKVLEKNRKEVLSLDSAFMKLGAGLAGYLAVDSIVSFASSSIKAFDDSVVAQTKLTTALGFTSNALNEQASALQGVTRFEDDSITSMQGVLATYRLSEAQIKKLTPAILDMATATGMDLDAAAQKVGKSITTKTNALARDGIEIESNLSRSEKLDSVMQKLNERFGGQAQAIAAVAGGPLVSLNNKFGDLQENIGNIITKNVLFEKVTGLANFVLDKMLSLTGQQVDVFADLQESIDNGAIPSFMDLNKVMAAGIPVAQSYGKTMLSSVTVAKFGSQEAVDAMKSDFKTVSASVDVAMVNFSDKQNQIEKQIAESKKRRAAANRKSPNEEESGKGGDIAFLAPGLGKEVTASIEAAQAITDARNAMRQSELDSREQGKSMHSDWVSQQLEVIALEDEKIKKQQELILMHKLERAEGVSTAASLVGALGSLNQALKGNAKVTQALLIGETIMNTAASIMKIMAQGGLFAIPMAVTAGIMGAAQVATIASQKFANGGWPVASGNSRSDNVPVMVSPKERIVSAREIESVGGRDAFDRSLRASMRDSGGRTVNVVLNGPVDRRYVRDILIPEIEMESSR